MGDFDSLEIDYNWTESLAKALKEGMKTKDFFANLRVYADNIDLWIKKYDGLLKNLNDIRQSQYRLYSPNRDLNENDWTLENSLYVKDGKKLSGINFDKINESKYNNIRNMLMMHTLKGYELIHNIREAFTGEVIKYKILTKENGEIYESALEMKDILSKAQIDLFTVSNNYNTSEKDPSKNFTKINSININFKELSQENLKEKRKYEHSYLYEKIESHYKTENWLGTNKGQYNRGNIHETVEYLVNKKNFDKNDFVDVAKGRAAELIRLAMDKAKANTDEHILGGDMADQELQQYQLKNISNSGARLTGSDLIRKKLETLSKYFKNAKTKETLRIQLENLFIKTEKKDYQSVLNDRASKKARQYLRKAFRNLT